MRTLVGFGTRHTLSDTTSDTRGVGAAQRWIRTQFEAISAECGGCLDVMEVSGVVSGVERIPGSAEIVNVVAIQRGERDPDRMVLMTAHFDSRVNDVMDATSDAPGANDNASGVAGTLEAARVLSRHRFAGTIVYAALSGEEQGLYGGEILADHARAQGWRIKAVLNNDMIGNVEGANGVVDNTRVRVFSEGVRALETPAEAALRRATGGELDSPARNLARYMDKLADAYVPGLDVTMVYRLDRFGRGSDQIPFSNAGFPAVRIVEANENFDRQHQLVRETDGRAYGDVIDGVDFDYAAKIVTLDVVTLASLASAPPFPADVTVEGAVSPHTTLRWSRPVGEAAAELDGYRVWWRPTDAPQWMHSRWAGDATEITLENVSIDNFFFGVSAVSVDGAETPAVYPGPAGSFGD